MDTETNIKLGVDLIVQERLKQIRKGWTAEHDDTHTKSELAEEAARWILQGTSRTDWADGMCGTAHQRESKPRIQQLIIGAALALAEAERLMRGDMQEQAVS